MLSKILSIIRKLYKHPWFHIKKCFKVLIFFLAFTNFYEDLCYLMHKKYFLEH